MQKICLTLLRKRLFSGPQIMQIYFNYYLFPVTLLLKMESVKEKIKALLFFNSSRLQIKAQVATSEFISTE